MHQIEKLHKQYSGVIYDLCYKLLSDSVFAEDAVQETFVNAFRSLNTFRYGDNYLPWLYRIATNVCYKMLHKNRRMDKDTWSDRPELKLDDEEMSRKIHMKRLLECLMGEQDERGREIIVAYYVWGMRQNQIADSLGISRRAVVKRLSALRKRAANLLGDGVAPI